jgi:hypothetical protein
MGTAVSIMKMSSPGVTLLIDSWALAGFPEAAPALSSDPDQLRHWLSMQISLMTSISSLAGAARTMKLKEERWISPERGSWID